jgi:hypothetical protein
MSCLPFISFSSISLASVSSICRGSLSNYQLLAVFPTWIPFLTTNRLYIFMTQTTLATRHKRLPLPACHILSINPFSIGSWYSTLQTPSVFTTSALRENFGGHVLWHCQSPCPHPKQCECLDDCFTPNYFIRKITTRFLRIHPAVVTSKPP